MGSLGVLGPSRLLSLCLHRIRRSIRSTEAPKHRSTPPLDSSLFSTHNTSHSRAHGAHAAPSPFLPLHSPPHASSLRPALFPHRARVAPARADPLLSRCCCCCCCPRSQEWCRSGRAVGAAKTAHCTRAAPCVEPAPSPSPEPGFPGSSGFALNRGLLRAF